MVESVLDGARERRARRRGGLALSRAPGSVRVALLIAYAVLGVAWLFSDPPFSGPDETAHYLRAVGISDGSLIGPVGHGPPLGVDALQRRWTAASSRSVSVPAGLSPDGYACDIDDPRTSAACTQHVAENPSRETEISSVGTYLPLPYLLPALVLRGAHDAAGSLRLARLAALAVWLALLAGALSAVWDRERGIASLTGLVAAVTPMVVFLGASLTDSSDEIMASVAFFAALLRLARERAAAPRWVWWLAAVGGFILSLSRPLGPIWIAAALGVWLVLAGRRALAATLRGGGHSAVACGAIVAAGIGLSVAWDAAYQPHAAITLLPSVATWLTAQHQLREVLGDLVGNFGYRNVPLSPIAICAWAFGAAALLLAGFAGAGARGRSALAVTLALAVVLPIVLVAVVLINTGFGLQGRHILPLVVMLPLLGCELMRGARRRDLGARLPRSLFGIVALIAGVVQLVAWWTDAHRYAVGSDGPLWFLGSASWTPPAGWLCWALLVLAACATLALCGVRVASTRPDVA